MRAKRTHAMWACAAAALLLAACDLHFGSEQTCDRDEDCPAASSCVGGVCLPCPSCEIAQLCLAAQCFANSCGGQPCPAGLGCVDGACADASCVGVSCAAGQSCVGGRCYPLDCPAGPCDRNSVCVSESCVPSTCVGVQCPAGHTCAAGQCYPSDCAGVPCGEQAACIEERCQPIACGGITCPAGTECAGGFCAPVDCPAQACAAGQACFAGACVDAGCVGVTCPSGTFCEASACVACELVERACGDGRDEDCDGLTDCEDPQCLDQPCGAPRACATFACTTPGACEPRPLGLGTECRGAAGLCDLAEACDGVSADCPADDFDAASTCRPGAGDCDTAEACDGFGPECPPDAVRGVTAECRAAAGDCDLPESCDGAGIHCPANAKTAAATECRPAAGDCDRAETCDGAAVHCPADAKAPALTECRAAAGDCDLAESCDGASIHCPADARFAAATECRPAAGDCDVAEVCDGANPQCPADLKFAADRECRAAGGDCDLAEICDGASADCPADLKVAGAVECRAAAGACDLAELCDGSAVHCPADARQPIGFECRPQTGDCDAAETCDGSASCPADAVQPTTVQCAPAAFCDGTSKQCPNATIALTTEATLLTGTDTAAFGGTCTPSATIAVSGADSGSTPCSASGTWSYTTLPQTADGSRGYVFTLGTSVSVTWTRDTQPPLLTSTEINAGAAYANTPVLQVRVAATDLTGAREIRAAEANVATGDCQGQFADAGWQAYDPAQPYLVMVAPIDGAKKVCAWARDALGNVSSISPPAGTSGRDSDGIELQAGNIPVVTALSVSNGTAGANFGTRTYAPGDVVRIDWTATDAEGLASDPIAIHYTTDGATWQTAVARHGGLTGNPTTYSGSYTAFLAPSSGFFRIKVVAWDQAGNSSLAALSDSQNTARWSIWAGSTDTGLGGTARSTALKDPHDFADHLDVDPLSGDLYAHDDILGLVRLDVASGLTSLVLRKSTATNLPDDGPLPADPTFQETLHYAFDSDGLLYVSVGPDNSIDSRTVYQIDLRARRSKRYLGPGTSFGPGALPSNVFVQNGALAFDESHTLYFVTSCSPGTWTSGTSTVRLLAARQNADKTAGAISVAAGNCVKGAPPRPGPGNAVSSPLTDASFPQLSSMAVWNNGAALYYNFHQAGTQKVLAGQSYASSVPGTSSVELFHDAASGKLYAADGPVWEITPNLAGANGDTAAVLVSNTGTLGSCILDGSDATQACADAHFGLRKLPHSGTVIFVDDTHVNIERHHRIRYVDSQGKMRTLLGTLPFHEDGLPRGLVRSSFGGIYYKRASEPSQAAFPAGLYFLDWSAPLFGYVDPANDRVRVLWGNQRQLDLAHPTGTLPSPSLTMGTSYQTDGKALAFDAQGLPWLQYNGVLASLDATGRIVARGNRSGPYWETAQTGTDPATYKEYPHGAIHNLTLKNQGAFLFGGYLDPGITDTLSIRLFDFSSPTGVTKLMGASRNTYSPDETRTGRVVNLSLHSTCQYTEDCYVVYGPPAEDRLYFSEPGSPNGWSLRFITAPSNPSTSTLQTLFASNGLFSIQNFAFSLDGQQIFFLDGDGKLRCHDHGSGKSWCNDAVLGPPAGMAPIGRGPNQLTWMDPSKLLISNYKGEIYLYEPPP